MSKHDNKDILTIILILFPSGYHNAATQCVVDHNCFLFCQQITHKHLVNVTRQVHYTVFYKLGHRSPLHSQTEIMYCLY